MRYNGPVGSPPDRAVAQLPARPVGVATDIGAAIQAALADLEASSAPVLTVVLATDGKHEPPRGTRYQATTGPAWDALAQRGQTILARHAVSAEALEIGRGPTDAALLKGVFPDTLVQALPSDQIAPHFEKLKNSIRINKARALLAADVAPRVEVSWKPAQLPNVDLNAGTAEVEVTFRSTAKYLPLVVTPSRVESRGDLGARVDRPAAVDLAPGESKTTKLKLRFDAVGGFGFGEQPVSRSGGLRLDADVTSPWAAVLRSDFATEVRPTVAPAELAVTGRGTTGWNWLTFALLALGLLLLAALAMFFRSSRQPSLRGHLQATAPAFPPQSARLVGKRAAIGKAKRSIMPALPGRGEVRAHRIPRAGGKRGSDIELVIDYSADGAKAQRKRCKPNAQAVFGSTTFTFNAPTSGARKR